MSSTPSSRTVHIHEIHLRAGSTTVASSVEECFRRAQKWRLWCLMQWKMSETMSRMWIFFLQIHFGSSGGFGGCCEESWKTRMSCYSRILVSSLSYFNDGIFLWDLRSPFHQLCLRWSWGVWTWWGWSIALFSALSLGPDCRIELAWGGRSRLLCLIW
jgi:hypothetical protein